ncbi:hypothetical protein D910_02005 [Dendroctonus ponderosae]|uniref:Ig-like domain-containing protein n=1 Tax=Dendroctonus ponderosae TaxID=77166 RepID=U4U1U5_DENPD|nr:hypothetical protein D910_02005 [Dendroctonus ponderosae]
MEEMCPHVCGHHVGKNCLSISPADYNKYVVLSLFQVAWVRVDTQTILSIHHNVITQNPRISLSYNDHRSWYLHVKNVQEVDRGWYMCQVNTDPMRSRKGYLEVVVSPTIIDQETSSDMVVLESTNVSLTCKATGYPEPYVMWRREDGEIIRYNGENVNVVDGEVLFITKVSRLHMGVYLCIASNGVPPSISKRVQLKVQFPPMLSIPNQLEGAYIGQDVTLECRTEAFPTSINYWTTERGDMIISGIVDAVGPIISWKAPTKKGKKIVMNPKLFVILQCNCYWNRQL